MLYPLLFTPIYKEMVWGGSRLRQRFHRATPFEKTGESWDITCRPQEMAVVENGPFAGRSLAEIIADEPMGIMGRRLANEKRFPLLIKIIDANDHLSVQVHPSDRYAAAAGESGKTEMWYVMEAPEDGQLIIGLQDGVTRETLEEAAETGRVEECLHRLTVKEGDIINIPAGLVHALTRGVMVAEVQQNSDITYRLYDYNRMGLDGKPRALHRQACLAVTDFSGNIPKTVITGLILKKAESQLTYAIANAYFAIIKYTVDGVLPETANPDAFSVFTCVKGSFRIVTPEASVAVPESRSVFIPAGLGDYKINGSGVLLKSFVPDVEKDFISPLLDAGYTRAEIESKTAVTQ